MKNFSPREYVEQFHLLFLDQLGQKLDKRLYALKGGCNLRFFFNSIRFSEDIDLDVTKIAKDTLTKKINNILSSYPFQQMLKLRGIEIDQYTTPKQTMTTQRWKIMLKTETSPVLLHTKVEFSRRGFGEGIELKTVDSKFIREYKLHPIFVSQYDAQEAFKQKIEALVGRVETQARDVFDLHHLLQYVTDTTSLVSSLGVSKCELAIKNIMNISYDSYKSLVISYLESEYQKQYDDPIIWENMVLKTVEILSCD